MPPFFSRSSETFRDRADAGARLADELRPHLTDIPADDVVAVGLARGGVIVAAEVARRLGIRLEAIVVRKLGAPDQPELAVGALTASGDEVLNQRLVDEIGIAPAQLDQIVARARAASVRLCEEIGAPARVPGIRGKTVLLIDDGMATGATMRAAIQAMANRDPGRLIVALPVAPASSIDALRRLVDDVVVVLAPANLQAVGQWYERFLDTPSEDVRAALDENRRQHTPA
jgi:predicted phosphoribosyltransferase